MTKATAVLALSAVILGGAAFIAGRISTPPMPVESEPELPFKTAVVVVPVQSLPPAPVTEAEPVLQSVPEPAPAPQMSLPVAPPLASVAAPEEQTQSIASEVAAVRETIADDDQARVAAQAEAEGHAEAVRAAIDGLKAAEANLAGGDTDGLQAAIDVAASTLGDSAQPLLDTARDRLDNEDLNGVRDALAVLLDRAPH